MIPEDIKDRFVYFCEERESIRIKRHEFELDAPFTEDNILQEFKFCNINREHDAVTLWVSKNVRNSVNFEDKLHLIAAMATCRVFNQPNTLQDMDFSEFDVDSWFDVAQEIQNSGESILRGAYMMPSHGSSGKGRGVVEYYRSAVKSSLIDLSTVGLTYLQDVADVLTTVQGLGAFLVNQVCTDLRYHEAFEEAPDWTSFIMCGPGTKRGINRFFGLDKDKAGKQEHFKKALLDIRDNLSMDEQIRDYFEDPNNLSNSFCEFDKYERARDCMLNETKPKLRKWK